MKNVLICNQISINLRSVRSMPNKMTDRYRCVQVHICMCLCGGIYVLICGREQLKCGKADTYMLSVGILNWYNNSWNIYDKS